MHRKEVFGIWNLGSAFGFWVLHVAFWIWDAHEHLQLAQKLPQRIPQRIQQHATKLRRSCLFDVFVWGVIFNEYFERALFTKLIYCFYIEINFILE